MANKLKRICRADGCAELTANACGYCDAHLFIWDEKQQRREDRRLPAQQRGYDYRWARYSKWFLAQPQNRLCALRLDGGCAGVAQCVDHIDPPESRFDPKFWDRSNHQPACIHCNSKKGHRYMVGAHTLTYDSLLSSEKK